MQVTAAAPIREHEKPMSWARAVVIATGFFFIAAIFLGQIPSYVYTVATLSTLARLEQGFLSLGLLSLGIGLVAMEVSMLYDPKPLVPWPLFALVGVVLTVVGVGLLFAVFIGPNNGGVAQLLPTRAQGPFISSIWFQPESVDLGGVGLVALLTGLGMASVAALNPWVLSGRAFGPTRDLLVRLCLGASIALLVVYVTILTFAPAAIHPINPGENGNASTLGPPYALGNVVLFLALALALFALEVWLLPIMTANRQEFMPAVYLHGVVSLIGNVAAPLLIVWVVASPLVYGIHQLDTAQFWVQCSQKKNIPGSCSFTPFTGYIICAAVFGAVFTALLAAHYFWSTRRNTVIVGGTIALIWLGLAASLLHTHVESELPTQASMGLVMATSVAILAFIFTWATQREFAPTRAAALGCAGQWLVLGTLMLIFLFGFALFSMPQFFELESGLAFFYRPGLNLLHDAFWVLLLMGGLAALQLAFLTRQQPMSDTRKFAMWTLLISVLLMVIAGIQGFHADFFQGGLDVVEASHVLMFFALILEVIGILVALAGSRRAHAGRWTLGILIALGVGIAVAVVMYSLPVPYPELVILGLGLAMLGALTYSVIGPDDATVGVANGLPATNGAATAPAR